MLGLKRDLNSTSDVRCVRNSKYSVLKILSKNINPNVVQKMALLGTATILRSVLSITAQDGVSKKKDVRGESWYLRTPDPRLDK